MNEKNPHSLLVAKRILILGSPGSGKSHFSAKLAKQTGKSLIRLDDVYWGKNWQRPDNDSFWQKLEQLLNQDNWIMDGNYHKRHLDQRLIKADTIIYFDVPTHVSLRGIFERSIKRYFGDRSTLPEKIKADASYKPQWEISFRFLRLVLLFKKEVRPLIFTKLATLGSGKSIIVFKSRRQAEQLLADIST